MGDHEHIRGEAGLVDEVPAQLAELIRAADRADGATDPLKLADLDRRVFAAADRRFLARQRAKLKIVAVGGAVAAALALGSVVLLPGVWGSGPSAQPGGLASQPARPGLPAPGEDALATEAFADAASGSVLDQPGDLNADGVVDVLDVLAMYREGRDMREIEALQARIVRMDPASDPADRGSAG